MEAEIQEAAERVNNSPEQALKTQQLERTHLARLHAVRERLLDLQVSGEAEGIEKLLSMNAALIEFAEERLEEVTDKA